MIFLWENKVCTKVREWKWLIVVEKLNEREAGKTKKVVFMQTKALIGVFMYEYEKEHLTINICK